MQLCERIGLTLPIIQAPMAGSQGHALAAAVSNAGGLGSLPAAMLNSEALAEELTALTRLTQQPYNVNVFCHAPPAPDPLREAAWRDALSPFLSEYDIDPETLPTGPGRLPFSAEAADVLEAFNPPVVSFHFDLPDSALLDRVRGWGSLILASATTVEEAQWLEAHGVDAIIAQGLEAGGHRGMFLTDDLTTQIGTFALVPAICRSVNVPVIAAGGIADAQGVSAALALGAAAAQIGTAFLLCPEATTSRVHRAALQGASAGATAVTNVFSGRPARGIVNRLMRELGPISDKTPSFPLATAAVSSLRARAEAHGCGDFSPLWAGQNTSGCKAVPAGQLTRELAGNNRPG